MSFPRYERYKDSGVEWLGQVPAQWLVIPLRQVVSLVESGTSVNAVDRPAETGEFGVLKTSCVYLGEFDAAQNKAVLPEEHNRVSCPLRPGTLIVSRMNTPDLVGAAGLVRDAPRGLFLPDRLWQVHFADVEPSFAHYWTLTHSYRAQVQMACTGTSSSMQNLSQDQFRSFIFPQPQLREQLAIVAFLDRETAKIDALVEEQRQLIELLKEKRQAVISHAVTRGLDPTTPLKESGVEWLGRVPEHWEVRRIGCLFGEATEEGLHDLPVLSVSIHDGVSDKELSDDEADRKITRSEDRTKYKRVQPNDLVYNMMRAWQGGFGTVQVEGMVSPAYVVARPLSAIHTRFVEHMLRTAHAVEEIRRYSHGVTDFRLRLYWDEFKNIRLAIPPLREQQQILAFIEENAAGTAELVATAEHSIALLQERRTALISAAVTGKIDVRGATPLTEEAA
ncbi:restriction endonuclease subunit S [Hyphomicrobium sp. NDB2Meth4]|uniref:restriction endonuclease subunit S n=1 Tax=Hyphomicrobium sp. NDB2Meth4 TaxID=1892846 RepID=UPI000930E16B|nr:restriction endonuclease subunit S [Hyphomicrobium sp. NDB2Meth4]